LHVAPLQASTRFYPCFTLPTARSPGFGSDPSDLWHVNTTPLVNCGYLGFPSGAQRMLVTLATRINSLARYSKRTVELRRALPHYRYQVSESFHTLLRVLFSFPSLYWYAIGLILYLMLEVDASQIPVSYPRNGTQDTAKIHCTSLTGLSPSTALCSKRLQIVRLG
jgi:hypothetical protein